MAGVELLRHIPGMSFYFMVGFLHLGGVHLSGNYARHIR